MREFCQMVSFLFMMFCASGCMDLQSPPPNPGGQRTGVTTNPAATDADGDGVLPPADCNDANAAIHPYATEVCDGMDNDCDGAIDEGCGTGGTNPGTTPGNDCEGSNYPTSLAPGENTDGLVVKVYGPWPDAESLELAGEVYYQNRGWRSLATSECGFVRWQDAFFPSNEEMRFSGEWGFTDGSVSWTCISGIVQGEINAWYDGVAIPVQTINAPSSDGCEMWIAL